MGEVASSFLPLPAGYQDLRPDVPLSDSAFLPGNSSLLPHWAGPGTVRPEWKGLVLGNLRGTVGWGHWRLLLRHGSACVVG